MVRCEQCGTENKADARFCRKCGHPLQMAPAAPVEEHTCPNCGAVVKAGVRFCRRCGHNLSAPRQAPGVAPTPAAPPPAVRPAAAPTERIPIPEPQPRRAASPTVPGPRQVPLPAAPPPRAVAPQPPVKRKASPWVIAGIGFGVVACLAVIVIGGLSLFDLLPGDNDTKTEDWEATREPLPEATVAPVVVPPVQFKAPEKVEQLYIEYILDASGSMSGQLPDGTYKQDVAREVLLAHYRSYPPAAHIGLRAYGHSMDWRGQEDESCADIELIAPVETGQATVIADWLADFSALGMTPLTEAIRQAVNDFENNPARTNVIIMISDGQETCGGDPCQVVRDLKMQGIEFTLHVVGFDVDAEAEAQLSCIAEAGGGVYHAADTADALKDALIDISDKVVKAAEGEAPASPTPEPGETEEPSTAAPPTLTLTPAPSATPTPCLPDSTFVQDVTVPDDTVFAPGESFTKVWRIQSNGCAAWPDGALWVFVSGEQLGAPGSVPVPKTAPGSTTDISVEMRAPDTPGTYKGYWQLQAPNGTLFGDRVYVQIVVPQPASISFVADRYTVRLGQCVTISWLVENAAGVLYNGESVGNQESRLECPLLNAQYELAVQDLTGAWDRRYIDITVDTQY